MEEEGEGRQGYHPPSLRTGGWGEGGGERRRGGRVTILHLLTPGREKGRGRMEEGKGWRIIILHLFTPGAGKRGEGEWRRKKDGEL